MNSFILKNFESKLDCLCDNEFENVVCKMAANCLVFNALNTMSIPNELNAEPLFATSSHTGV